MPEPAIIISLERIFSSSASLKEDGPRSYFQIPTADVSILNVVLTGFSSNHKTKTCCCCRLNSKDTYALRQLQTRAGVPCLPQSPPPAPGQSRTKEAVAGPGPGRCCAQLWPAQQLLALLCRQAPSPCNPAWPPQPGQVSRASPVARQGATRSVVWGWGWPPLGWGPRALLLVPLCSGDDGGALATAAQRAQRQRLPTQRPGTAAPRLPPGTPGLCKLHRNSDPWCRGLRLAPGRATTDF